MEFTEENAEEADEALNEIMESFSDSQAREFFGHCNHISLFIQAAKAEAASEEDN